MKKIEILVIFFESDAGNVFRKVYVYLHRKIYGKIGIRSGSVRSHIRKIIGLERQIQISLGQLDILYSHYLFRQAAEIETIHCLGFFHSRLEFPELNLVYVYGRYI